MKIRASFVKDGDKCIYIDPPYNTSNENWVYDDAVNGPEIRNRLGNVIETDRKNVGADSDFNGGAGKGAAGER